MLARLRGKHVAEKGTPAASSPPPAPAAPPAAAQPPARTGLPDIALSNASIEIRDEETRLRLAIPSLSGEIRPGTRLALRMRGVHGGLAFCAEAGAAPASAPTSWIWTRRLPA